VTPDDTELVADLRELSHRSLVAGRGGDRLESLSTQVEELKAELAAKDGEWLSALLAKEREQHGHTERELDAANCLLRAIAEVFGHKLLNGALVFMAEAAVKDRDQFKAALAVERAHSGEQDVRIAGLEVERDAARVALANVQADLAAAKQENVKLAYANDQLYDGLTAELTIAVRQGETWKRVAREAEDRANQYGRETDVVEAIVARRGALLLEAANVFRGVLTSPLPLTPGSRDSMVLWLAEVEAELAPAPDPQKGNPQ
jgi:hypothetical protein